MAYSTRVGPLGEGTGHCRRLGRVQELHAACAHWRVLMGFAGLRRDKRAPPVCEQAGPLHCAGTYQVSLLASEEALALAQHAHTRPPAPLRPFYLQLPGAAVPGPRHLEQSGARLVCAPPAADPRGWVCGPSGVLVARALCSCSLPQQVCSAAQGEAEGPVLRRPPSSAPQ